ncbi:ATP-binding protein [Streptomyces jeddahensis]|uniref:Putative HTH-type transcriptional regulatorc n=1 Tax=Streptomyces jeddahensis TaxID=1716141 RepID=A0A177HR84_9ACTN|nr:AAA family ATPase [Streptomyces jeddahensis]OAH12724.1 putative HTH-type transcriptional regulatorc [Streptomyces jeddahensis]
MAAEHAPTRHRGNLPGEPDLVGRRQELSEAGRLLADVRLLTLTGVAGVGKTRLARRVADQVRAAFPDGVWLVELAPLDNEGLLPQTVAGALGLRYQAAPHPTQLLVDHLRDKRALLVLDNCEHLLTGCALLTDRLLREAPRLRVLVTSRQPLRLDGESVMTVEPLPVPAPDLAYSPERLADHAAVRLFALRAGQAVQGFVLGPENLDYVVRLCRRLDGLPLAIELAAVGLRTLTAEQILHRLDQRLEPARGITAAAPPRHETLTAAIDWSFDLCSPGERALWARVSVFAGSFDLEAAEEVCSGDGIARDDVLDLVAGLVDKSILVRQEEGDRVRYRLLETIRQYGADRLAGLGLAPALQRRHRDWYHRLACRAEEEWLSPRQEQWLARLRSEHANLRAALDFSCADPAQAGPGLEIAAALWPHWICGGHLSEGRHWLGRLLRLAPDATVARGRALWVDAWLATAQGDTASARPRLAQCWSLALHLDHPPTRTRCTQHLGALALYEGDFPRAGRLLQEALAGHRAAGDRNGVMTCLYHLTMACALYGDYRAALFGEECLALCEAAGAQWSRSYALWALGLYSWRQGEARRGTELVRDALRTRWAVQDGWGMAQCLEVLAWFAASSGQPEASARMLGSAAAMWRSIGTSPSGFRHLAAGHEQTAARLRGDLGEQAYEDAFRAGAGLAPDAAVGHALHDPAPTHA